MASDGPGAVPGRRLETLPSFANSREGIEQLRRVELSSNSLQSQSVTVLLQSVMNRPG